MRYNNANYIYHKDHQGSVTEITAASQSTVKSYEYDAYGNILQETGPAVPGGFTYTGRELHSRSGLYYYRARFYDPSIGRFISRDPIGYLGGVNLYAYVGNGPINRVDPLGLLQPEDEISTWDRILFALEEMTKEFAKKVGIIVPVDEHTAEGMGGLVRHTRRIADEERELNREERRWDEKGFPKPEMLNQMEEEILQPDMPRPTKQQCTN